MTRGRDKYSRRDFIGRSIKGTAGLMAYPFLKRTSSDRLDVYKDTSRVVVVEDEDAVIGNAIQPSAVQAMVDSGIQHLTGLGDVGEAWLSLFPGITRNSVIGIKINCIARQDNPSGLASHPEVIYAIANGLTRMQVEGLPFPEENIIIWDRAEFEMTRAGFSINESETGVKCYGTRYSIMNNGTSTSGYSTAVLYDVSGIGQYLSRILVDECNYLINTCLLKDHAYSGVTLSLKNHYGSCWDPSHLHNRYCMYYIPPLNALPPIREKQVLCMCDALFGIVSGGPMGFPQVTPKSLIFSTDPVAHDTIGMQMLKEYGTPDASIVRAEHIARAAGAPYNLGTNDPDQIDVITVENPSTAVLEPMQKSKHPDHFQLFQNYPNPFNARTTVSYRLNMPSRVRMDIFNLRGVHICRLMDKQQESGYFRITWDGKTSGGIDVSSGIYLCRFDVGGAHHTLRMQLVR